MVASSFSLIFYVIRIAFLPHTSIQTPTHTVQKHENGSHFVIRMRLGNHLIQLPSRAAALAGFLRHIGALCGRLHGCSDFVVLFFSYLAFIFFFFLMLVTRWSVDRYFKA